MVTGGRTIGPVTTSCTMGTAVGYLLAGLLNRWGWELTADEVAALMFIATGLGGWLAKPKGKHA